MAPLTFKTKISQFLIMILFVLDATTMCDAAFTRKYIVSIKNSLDDNANLRVHCQSKDDDLGWHDIPHGDQYSFSFTPRVFGNTLFFCRMEFSGGVHYIDIYDQDRDQLICNECCWSVKSTGTPCRAPCNGSTSEKCFDWKS